MADLKVLPPKPGFSEPAAPPIDFGPDASTTPKNAPKVNVENPPKSAASVFGKLGTNKKSRSPVRRLTREAGKDELSDLDRLASRYEWLSNITSLIHPRVSGALYEQRYTCATAWFELAENNDTVRRYILGFIEGGAWGGVIAAHAPILMAVIPEKTLEAFFLKGMGMFATKVEEDTDEAIFPNWEAEPQP